MPSSLQAGLGGTKEESGLHSSAGSTRPQFCAPAGSAVGYGSFHSEVGSRMGCEGWPGCERGWLEVTCPEGKRWGAGRGDQEAGQGLC